MFTIKIYDFDSKRNYRAISTRSYKVDMGPRKTLNGSMEYTPIIETDVNEYGGHYVHSVAYIENQSGKTIDTIYNQPAPPSVIPPSASVSPE